MEKGNRFFILKLEEADDGCKMTVSANSDTNFIVRNVANTLVEHEVFYNLMSASIELANAVKKSEKTKGRSTERKEEMSPEESKELINNIRSIINQKRDEE